MSALPDQSGNGVLCITGMHRSGTSLVASWLERCGLAIADGRVLGSGPGNPHGHFEDLDFFDLQQASLVRQFGSWQVTDDRAAAFDAAERAQASALLEARSQRFNLWGWKDPRTVLLLHEWKRLRPGIKALIVWRPCVEVMQSIRQRARIARGNKNLALGTFRAASIWHRYNRAACELKRAYPDDVLLISVWSLLGRDREIIEHCKQAWKLDLTYSPITELRDPDLLRARGSIASLVASRLIAAPALERELQSLSDMRS